MDRSETPDEHHPMEDHSEVIERETDFQSEKKCKGYRRLSLGANESILDSENFHNLSLDDSSVCGNIGSHVEINKSVDEKHQQFGEDVWKINDFERNISSSNGESKSTADGVNDSDSNVKNDFCDLIDLSLDFSGGLPEKYLLPSPTVQSVAHSDENSSKPLQTVATHDSHSTIFNSFDSIQMTRGEPMGEESENGNMGQLVVNFSNQPTNVVCAREDSPSDSCISETESNSSMGEGNQECHYVPEEIERPPVVGQSNDPRGQVASGMSGNSSDASSSYNSAVSGSWKEDAEAVETNNIKDTLSVKVSLLLGDNLSSDCNSSDDEIKDGEDCQLKIDNESELNTEEMIIPSEGISNLGGDCNHVTAPDENLMSTSDAIVEIGLGNNAGRKVEISESFVVRSSDRRFPKESMAGMEAEPEKDSSFTDARPTSPTSVSSIASSKRLEWDSGADIGYKMISTSTMSQTEAEVLQWANHHLPLTRTEPEGKSFQKEKGRAVIVKPRLHQLEDPKTTSDLQAITNSSRNNLEVEKVKLDSSMTSITSEIFKEVLYGTKETPKVGPKSGTDDDVIIRVRRLLETSKNDAESSQTIQERQPTSSSNNGVHEGDLVITNQVHFDISPSAHSDSDQHACSTEKYHRPLLIENSPSHSSSSWSAKSSNTVVMTPVGERLDDIETIKDAYLSPVESEDRTSNNKYDNHIFFRRAKALNVGVNSVSVQTDLKGESSVPRPIFPRGKSKSLDILPTVLVDAAVNTEFPYSPSSEENVTSPDDVIITDGRYLVRSALPVDGSYTSSNTKINTKILISPIVPSGDDFGQGELTTHQHLSAFYQNQGLGQNSEYCQNFYGDNSEYQDSQGSVYVPSIMPAHATQKNQVGKTMKKEEAYQLESKNTTPSQEKFTQRVTPYWPSGSDNMYYTVEDMPSVSGYKGDESTLAQSCGGDPCQHSTYKATNSSGSRVGQLQASVSSADEHFSPVNVSKQSSSTDISLPTKRFVDRSQWLREMAQLERNRNGKSTQHQNEDYQQSEIKDNDSWCQVGVDASQSYVSTCNTPSEFSYPIPKKNWEMRRRPRCRTRDIKDQAYFTGSKSSLQNQLSRLKEMILEQQQSYLHRLWREVGKIERLEAMIPLATSRRSDTLSSVAPPSESELAQYFKNKHHKSKKNSRTKHHESSKNGIDAAPDTRQIKMEIKKNDFGQMYPSPVPPEPKQESNKVLQGWSSIGLQTTPSLIDVQENNKSQPSEKEVPQVKRPVGWVIPFHHVTPTGDATPVELTLQEALHLQVPLIQKLKGRHMKLTKTAQDKQDEALRNRILIHNMKNLAIHRNNNSHTSPAPGKQPPLS